MQFKRDINQNSSKLHLDKYYTSKELATYCVNKVHSIIGKDNISEYIEPSAGGGVFLDCLPLNTLAYDIEPEDDRIIQQNFLNLDLPYKEKRLIIGNPPYGARNVLSVQFFKKSIILCDYIAFILPISQLNNNQQMYEFDLIHSEDLGEREYTGKKVHCCFNIYRRPINNMLNNKPKNKLLDIKIVEVRLKNKVVKDYDLRICAWVRLLEKKLCQIIILLKNFI